MAVSDIRAAIETAVSAMTPVIETVFENTEYSPTIAQPFQMLNILFGKPSNLEYGSNFQELGQIRVALHYPAGTGAGIVDARFEMFRTAFKRGTVLTFNGVNVIIYRTPVKLTPYNASGWYVQPLSIYFYVNVGL